MLQEKLPKTYGFPFTNKNLELEIWFWLFPYRAWGGVWILAGGTIDIFRMPEMFWEND